MPCIGLLHTGRFAEFADFQELLATMMFPSDSGKRRQMVLQLLEAIRKQPPSRPIARERWELQMSRLGGSGISLSELDHFLFRSLPPHLMTAHSLEEEGRENFGNGLLAGQVLLLLIRIANSAPKHATLNKARFLLQTCMRQEVLKPDGTPQNWRTAFQAESPERLGKVQDRLPSLCSFPGDAPGDRSRAEVRRIEP